MNKKNTMIKDNNRGTIMKSLHNNSAECYISNKKFIKLIAAALLTLVFLPMATVQADDVEIYLKPPPEPLPPNILFLLDESGSMSLSFDTTSTTTRNQVLKNAMHDVINDPKLENVNAGIMGYTSGSRYRVIQDFLTMDTAANRTLLNDGVDSLKALSGTPSVEALRHSIEWFGSGYTDFNGDTGTSPLDPANYCSANSIVFLTDGQPKDNSRRRYPKGGSNPYCQDNLFAYGRIMGHFNGGLCAQDEVAGAFANDMRPSWAGLQNIRTFTVSMISPGTDDFTNKQNFLRGVAREGHGYSFDCGGLSVADTALCLDDEDAGFFQANSSADLVDALKSIVEATESSVQYTYNTPTIPIDPSNVASTGDYIYIPMLVPTVKNAWQGNLKKYKLMNLPNGTVQIHGDGTGKAVEDNPNVAGYNQFLSGAKDFWGDPSGNNPLAGGMIDQMAGYIKEADIIRPANFDTLLVNEEVRRLFTYLPGTSTTTTLSDPSNSLLPSNDPIPAGDPITQCSQNADITPAMLDVADFDTCKDILEWLVTGTLDSGTFEVDENGDPDPTKPIIDYKFAAPLHTQPSVVNYGSSAVVYLPTSDGILHAIDADTGKELWGFMPQPQLHDIKNFMWNRQSESLPTYGLDGDITQVYNDSNDNGIYDVSDGQLLLVFGQRRGGRNYYAIDVTSKNNPSYVYMIEGGTGPFSALGQTWSKPKFVTLDNVSEDKVLIFGGGYDPIQDNSVIGSRSSDTMGNKIYIVNAFTGAHIQTIPASSNGIAADVAAVDLDSDGLVDRIYAADVGGRIIRADLDQGANTWSSYVLADMGGAPNIKFFNAPTIGYESGSNSFLSVSIGSGNRSEPLEATSDSFFMIKDVNIWAPPVSPSVITKAMLADATNGAPSKAVLKSTKGWFFDLATGEKVYSKAAVLNYVVVFTTYSEVENANVCTATTAEGEGKLYALNMLSGEGVFKNNAGVRVPSKNLHGSGIPPSPVLVTTTGTPADPSDPNDPGVKALNKIIVGTESPVTFPIKLYQLNWEEVLESE